MILLLPMANTAATVVAQVQKYYANVQHLSGTFTEVVDNPTFGTKEPSKGNASAEKPDHLRLEYYDKKNKLRTVAVTDGKTLWLVYVMNTTVFVGTPATSQLPDALAFLTNKNLANDYTITLTGSTLELVPKAKSGTAKLVLVVDTTDGHVTESIVTNSEGVSEDITWSLDTKPSVNSSQFTVDPAKDYPSYAVKKM